MVGPSTSRPPMSHRKTDLGIPCREKSAKVVLGSRDMLIMRTFDDLFFRSMNTIIWRYSNRSNFEQRDG
jgi:hypothetical protein